MTFYATFRHINCVYKGRIPVAEIWTMSDSKSAHAQAGDETTKYCYLVQCLAHRP